MKVLETRLAGLVLLEPEVHVDDRGFFIETYQRRDYAAIGIDVDFVQSNHSRSARGTIRGLHYQSTPGQPKLVRVARGAIFDVVVDIRRESHTFGRHEAFELDDRLHRQLFVPIGFAHGFCTLSDLADVVYSVGSYYDLAAERGLAWDDPELGIAWPVPEPIVSPRDRANPFLSDLSA
jgi:dTDP-4-dehydrorhamnose 3,5-epimerase